MTSTARRERAQLRAARVDAGVLLPNSFRTAWVVPPGRHPRALGLPRARARLAADAGGRPAARPRAPVGYYLRPRARLLGLDGSPRARPRSSRSTAATRARAPTRCSRSTASTAARRSSASRPAPPTATPSGGRRSRVAELIARLGARRRHLRAGRRAGDRDAGREIESALPPGTRVVEPDRPHRSAAARRCAGARARRSCRTIRARCTWPRRSACR